MCQYLQYGIVGSGGPKAREARLWLELHKVLALPSLPLLRCPWTRDLTPTAPTVWQVGVFLILKCTLSLVFTTQRRLEREMQQVESYMHYEDKEQQNKMLLFRWKVFSLLFTTVAVQVFFIPNKASKKIWNQKHCFSGFRGLFILLLDRGLRQALQPGRLWLSRLPFSVLQAGAEVIGQTDAEWLSEPP